MNPRRRPSGDHARGTSAASSGRQRHAVYQSLERGIAVRMLVNGVTVDDDLVLALSGVVTNPALTHKLRTAHRFRSGVINLTNAERMIVLAALEGGSSQLKELREQLVEHPAWRSPTRIS